jgi:dipeptidyl aminopeptidase/acylaminoacyl peptidase
VDGGRIAAAGGSAGGHLAMLLGVTAARGDLDPRCGASAPAVRAVVSYSGLSDLPALAAGAPSPNAITDYAGPCGGSSPSCDSARSCDRCVDASPLAHACAASAPFVLVHAPEGFDPLVPVAQSVRMADALRAAGARAELVVPAGEELLRAGCERAHGLVGRCLVDASASVVERVLREAIGPLDAPPIR